MAIAKIHYMVDLSRSDIVKLIEEYIFVARDREIAKARWIDGMTFEEIAGVFSISERQAKTIIRNSRERVLRHIDQLNLHPNCTPNE